MGNSSIESPTSPAVMREGAVRLRHPMGVLALLDGVSPVVRSIQQLGREPVGHGLLVALARRGNDPADAERLAARGPHLDRHLVGGAPDAPRAHLYRRHYVVERLLEHRDRVLLGLALDDLQRVVDDLLRHRLLAGVHDRVHELGHHDVAEFRVRHDFAFLGAVTAGHLSALYCGLLLFALVPLWRPRASLRSPGTMLIVLLSLAIPSLAARCSAQQDRKST